MDSLFFFNPPDVLIYLSFPNDDIATYHEEMELKLIERRCFRENRFSIGDTDLNYGKDIMWNNLFSHKSRMDIHIYQKFLLEVIEDAIKRFDQQFVITMDGRLPVEVIFETVKAKLLTLPLQRTPIPKFIFKEDASISGSSAMDRFEYEADAESLSYGMRTRAEDSLEMLYEYDEGIDNVNIKEDENEESLRKMSEYGVLCPVNYSNGFLVKGNKRYTIEYMGKLYYFAGIDEVKLFQKFPRQFLEIPRPCMSIKAIFYGPEALAGPAARGACKFFKYKLIDVKQITETSEETLQKQYIFYIVNSMIKSISEELRIKSNRIKGVEIMQMAIGKWIKLNFDTTDNEDLHEAADEAELLIEQRTEGEECLSEDDSYSKCNYDNDLFQLRTMFESYGMDFIDDLDACIQAHNEPERLQKYFPLMPPDRRREFRENYLKENKVTRFDIITYLANDLRARREQYRNWIMINAPMESSFIDKLKTAEFYPSQIMFFNDIDPLHKFLMIDESTSRKMEITHWTIFEGVKNGPVYDATLPDRKPYSQFVTSIEDNASYIEEEENENYYYEEYELKNSRYENIHENEISNEYNNLSHDAIMAAIMPEIIERLNQYTADYLKKWYCFTSEVSDEGRRYKDFSVVHVKSADKELDVFKHLIEDTLYNVKRFLSNRAIPAPVLDKAKSRPEIMQYNGDTSIYCPVQLVKGKFVVGLKKYRAIYQNRYYYMSSDEALHQFILNPRKYASFSSHLDKFPKPKISLLLPFGLKTTNVVDEITKHFDMSVVEFYSVFKRKIVPKGMPMLGEMFEEPTLRKIMDKYLIKGNPTLTDNVNKIRKYMDLKSAYLSDTDWQKINSVFYQIDESICYINYPRNTMELMYLKDNEVTPDVIVNVTRDLDAHHIETKDKVAENWLSYQAAVFEKIIEKDAAARWKYSQAKSKLFKTQLNEYMNNDDNDTVKSRIEHVIIAIAGEVIKGHGATEFVCDQLAKKNEKAPITSSESNFTARIQEMTLRQKKIIINYSLTVEDLIRIEDFTILDHIDKIICAKVPKQNFILTTSFVDEFNPPTDKMVQRYLETESNEFSDMHRFAKETYIPWITAKADDPIDEIINKLDSVLVSNSNVFENVFDVDFELAERMLCNGEVYLSRFGRWCPVRLYEKNDNVQWFYTDYLDGHLRPVVHRKYVYYLSGPDNREKFGQCPLKYLLQTCSVPPCVALRMAIVGPPKSGKTYYARRLCAKFGFQLIRIEEAVKTYLKSYHWVEDVKRTQRMLLRGDTLEDSALIEVVKFAMQTTRANIRGFVIDGFPITEKQFELLNKSGIILHKIFVLNRSYRRCLANHKPGIRVTEASLRGKYDAWKAAFVGYSWIADTYGNETRVDGGLEQIETETMRCLEALQEYHRRTYDNTVCSLSNLPITKRERSQKMSLYLDSCSVCKVIDNLLSRPADSKALRTNLIQYQMYYYWACDKHYRKFMKDPERFVKLTPREPDIFPVKVTPSDLANNMAIRCERFSEFCVVCALSCLWNPVYKRGLPQYVVTYSYLSFAFCSPECQQAFMERPFLYSKYKIHVCGPDPLSPVHAGLAVADLPTMGFLEQTVAGRSSSALIELTAMKPVYPGLSESVSAMVFLGLYMGICSQDEDVAEYFKKALRLYTDTCHRFKNLVFKLKLLT
ncbi:adenylate kinase 9-like [Adelges cooleyi]|uniref:adenylate kinase 9-like n=1 Tax=Adelges cooleyi TaxID=133065 RepID=UPI00217F308C|nr:adenylate kinase 9-like [Adelges cooleyi]